MTQLIRQNWLTFDGDPITGRTPARVISMNGVELDQFQTGLVAYHYTLFEQACSLALGQRQDCTRILPDGTVVRMQSINGIDRVFVWPVERKTSEGGLPHGFCVTASWIEPQILGRTKIELSVPQLKNGASSNNQVIQRRGTGLDRALVIVPLVRDADGVVWDFMPHGGGTPALFPFALRFPGDEKLQFHPPHFSDGLKVYNADGIVLYEADPPPPFIMEDSSESTLKLLPAFTEGKGENVGLQMHHRASYASGTVKFVFRSEKLSRSAEDEYTKVGGHTAYLNYPIPTPPISSSDETKSQFDEDPAEAVGWTLVKTDTAASGIPWGREWGEYIVGVPPGGYKSWLRVSVNNISFRPYTIEVFYDIASKGARSSNCIASKHDESDVTEVVIDDIISVGSADGFESISLKQKIGYPSNSVWWGGYDSFGVPSPVYSVAETKNAGYGNVVNTIHRGKLSYIVDCDVYRKIDLSWCEVEIFHGDVDGRIAGRKFWDVRHRVFHDYTYSYLLFDRPNITGTAPEQEELPDQTPLPVGYTASLPDNYSGYVSGNDQNPRLIAMRDDFVETPDLTENEIYEPLANTVDYEFSARHVIDYDHRGQFYAALRVDVKCSGAKWKQAPLGEPAVVLGSMREDTQGSYSVKVAFEVKWAGQAVASQTLLEGSCTRRVFEAVVLRVANCFLYPAGQSSDFDILIRLPPLVSPPVEAIDQLTTFASHQGTNHNFACQDIESAAPYSDQQSASEEGIEYSGGEGAPHAKYTPGVLYARTFKCSDFSSNLLWLFSATCCDAPEDNKYFDDASEVMWYYMPEFGAALQNQVFHVEVRDGRIEDWSQHLVPGTDTETRQPKTRPADPRDWDMKITRV